MICDIMPTISEDGDLPGDGSMDDNNFEQLMVNMLDERDKLMETLRETQETLTNNKSILKETELERDTLLREFDMVLQKCDLDREQLIRKLTSFDGKSTDDSITARLKDQRVPLAEEFVSVSKELYQLREKMIERNEEIFELKAERSNTKLLLEHLESLVSRHERSLRMTVVKRQAQSSAGVSSEVEVLKALKSLFEHHKALDEKVRERLRMAVEKANTLEEDLSTSNQEIEHLQQELEYAREKRRSGRSNGDGVSNGPTSEDSEKVEELQEKIRDLKYQLEKSQKECQDTRDRFSSLEEQINNTTKKANYSFENNQRVQKELQEALAQKGDLEERMMTLEKRYVRSQNDLSSAADEAEKSRAEILSLQTMLEQRTEKINSLQEQCQFYEMKCSQTMKHAEELPKIQQELENREAALNAAEERNFTAEEQLQNMHTQIEEISSELSRSKESEKITEERNIKLQTSIDKLLADTNDRLQQNLKEKMQSIDEKAYVAQELDRTKQLVDEFHRKTGSLEAELDKLRKDNNRLKQNSMHLVVSSPRSPDDAMRFTQMEPIFSKTNQANLVHTNANKQFLPHAEFDGSDSSSVTSSNSKLSNVPPPAMNSENINSNDAQMLANVLQKQLDAINEELAMLQVEHRTTEKLTEQIEKRVGSETNSLDELSVCSSKGSDKHDGDKRSSPYRPFPTDPPVNRQRPDLNLRQDAEDGNMAFTFSSYDPVDTKPLMLKAGRSQELLTESELDTPNSQPSDSTGSEGSIKGKGLTIPWNISSPYESETYFEYPSNASSLSSSMESLSRRGQKNRGLKNSIGKIFSSKGKLKPRDGNFSRSGDDMDSSATDVQKDAETRMKRKILEDVIASSAPFAAWNAPTILAWLEMWVKLPEWYIQACRANVKSGSIMSALSDYEIQHEIGVNNPLHRMKLRLAIREMINVTSPISPPTAKTSLVFGDMNHFWIASEWLASLGLPQYKPAFIENLVDARMLEHITKKDYTKYLKVIDNFHRSSLTCGTKCLEVLNYDRKYLEKRRREAEAEDKDVLVWSNARVIRWAQAIGLEDYADFLRQSGVHGALIALDETFDLEQFAYFLQIPSTNEKKRGLLEREYNKLLILCHEYKTSTQPDLGDGDFKRSKSWRKKFKKEKLSSKDKRKEGDVTTASSRKPAGGSEGFSDPNDLTSPGRKQRKSPNSERKYFPIRGGPT